MPHQSSRLPCPPDRLPPQILSQLGFSGKHLWEGFVGLLGLAVSGRGRMLAVATDWQPVATARGSVGAPCLLQCSRRCAPPTTT